MALPPKYLPKIKVSTAKDMAKSLIANRTGQKISDTKFKQILKKDESLKTYYYKSKDAGISKIQAKKFFNQVVSTTKTTPGLKVSRLAQKMGIKPNADKIPSNIILNKLYQKATDTQLQATAPKGPSPEEVRKQQRHDEMMKTLHKRERADDIARSQQTPQQPDQQRQQPSRVAPPTMQGTITGATLKPTGGIANEPDRPIKKQAAEPDRLTLAVLPLINLSPAADKTSWLADRLTTQIRQALRNENMFSLATEPATADALHRYQLSIPADQGILHLIGTELHAQLVAYGHLKKNGTTIEINLYLSNIQNRQHLVLASLRRETDDIFDLERRLTWQIHEALSDKPSPETPRNTPSASDAVDLPI